MVNKTRAKKEQEPVSLDLSAVTFDLRKRWPTVSNSVDDAVASNVIQYLNAADRIHFVNELCRVLKPGGKAQIAVPYWSSNVAYGDIAVQWPPVVEHWFFHLNKDWREANNAKETRYSCDFDTTWGYSLHPLIAPRNQEYQQHAITFWKEAAQALVATLVKR